MAAGDFSCSAISLTRDLSPTSNESSSDQSVHSQPSSSYNPPQTTTTPNPTPAAATLEIQRKPRGRPRGSKNKPKPPIVITKDSLKPVVLEISAGSDVIETIANYARQNQVNISVISATGSVSNVTFLYPHQSFLPFGRILALNGSLFVDQPYYYTMPNNKPNIPSFGISVVDSQGQVFGGVITGKVTAATEVVVVATTFLNPTYHRPLPSGGSNNNGGEQTKSNTGGGGPINELPSGAGRSMYAYGVSNPCPINSQVPHPDVMPWGPPPSRSPHY